MATVKATHILISILALTSLALASRVRLEKVRDLKLTKCHSNVKYPITVDNVAVQLDSKSKLKVSGTLSSDIDLIAPIKASLEVKRDILGIWIPMPCEKSMGSCTYDDLCSFGYSTNRTCPQQFLDNDVPCRCPISKGNYTMKGAVDFKRTIRHTNILSGSYKGSVTVSKSDILLSCYDFTFELESSTNMPSVILIK